VALPLLELPHRRARALVATGAPVFLGVNPVEYHGPHLSLANDAVLSFGAARQLHALLRPDERSDWPFLWAGELGIGVDPVPGPGSQPVTMHTVRDNLWRACRGLVALGARALVLVTFHGAPLHNLAIDAVVRRLERGEVRAYAPAATLFRLFLEPDRQQFDPVYHGLEPALAEELSQRAMQDFHAGFLETSLALHFAPETVSDHDRVPPCPRTQADKTILRLARAAHFAGRHPLAQELTFAAEAVSWYRLKPFPGYTGIPGVASPAAGRQVADLALNHCLPVARRVLAGDISCPRPILSWLGPLTLDGRLTRRL
jgi:creatinine amidohydrolase